ncbi:hypothetical protein MAPG_00800 [Magnaporthiopsis poae ATCC 64411]|uniref:Uncharacterized protein n=1 Tax=Magnaporthiopsis poae (strain ATCC 64411 / 73-15) TaxID=644358 RepID=A0A0C4DLZ8_MAGP6|nr:hypothetical protein MAPG_00800 [Magnaporthiopsis poae ATCC 64411]
MSDDGTLFLGRHAPGTAFFGGSPVAAAQVQNSGAPSTFGVREFLALNINLNSSSKQAGRARAASSRRHSPDRRLSPSEGEGRKGTYVRIPWKIRGRAVHTGVTAH